MFNHWTKRSSKFGRKCVTYFSLASQRISTDIFWGTFTDIACKGNSCRVIILQITLLSRTGRTCCPNFDWWRNSMLILMLLNFWDVSRNLVNMEKYALIAQQPKQRADLVLNISIFLCLPYFTGPLMVLIEYVPYGDLLGYLRKSRGLNDTYFEDPDIKPQTNLTSEQLMKFAWQVSDGMSYLSSIPVSRNPISS